MDLGEHVSALRTQLITAAAAGTEQTRETARLLADAMEPAARLVLTDALVAMAAEVTRAQDGGMVEIRIRGGEPEVVVVPTPETVTDQPPDDDASLARISLRLPENLKIRAEAAAGDAGVSLNAWLVRAVNAGLHSPPPWTGRVPRRRTGFARS